MAREILCPQIAFSSDSLGWIVYWRNTDGQSGKTHVDTPRGKSLLAEISGRLEQLSTPDQVRQRLFDQEGGIFIKVTDSWPFSPVI